MVITCACANRCKTLCNTTQLVTVPVLASVAAALEVGVWKLPSRSLVTSAAVSFSFGTVLMRRPLSCGVRSLPKDTKGLHVSYTKWRTARECVLTIAC